MNCPLLQAPANGFIAGDCDTTYGSICHFSCNLPFYELVDPFNDIRTCQSNGEWSGKTAVCRGKLSFIPTSFNVFKSF